MATFYSDNYESTGAAGITAVDPTFIPAAGVASVRLSKRTGKITALALTTDLMRIIKDVPASTRIWGLLASANDLSAAGAFDVGVHQTVANGGAAVSANIFATALAKNSNRAESFTEATTLKPTDRGKRLWELLGLTSDSRRTYDITATPSTSFTTTALTILLELETGAP